MIIPPRPEYYGDTDKAKTLKGEAYQFFTFCCIGIGQALTMTRIKKFDNGNEIVAQVCRNPYGDLHGVVKIFVPPSGGEEFALICTSFNSGVDDGTQIYQAPYPPKTRGELILAGENTNGLVLPSPTYSARTNYRVNKSENETVSWDYVRTVVGGSNFKFAKVAIEGIETLNDTDLLYLEPYTIALLKPNQDHPETRFCGVFRDRQNYSGTGTTRLFKVFSYVMNTASGYIESIVLQSTLDLTALGYSNSNKYWGMFDDGLTVIYTDTNRSIRYFKLADDFASVVDDGLIFENVAAVYSDSTSGTVVTRTMTTKAETVLANTIDVRGNTLYFGIEKTDDYTWAFEQKFTPYGDLYYSINNETIDYGYYRAKYKDATLTKTRFETGSHVRTSSAAWNTGLDQLDGTEVTNASQCVIHAVGKIDAVYNIEQSDVTREVHNINPNAWTITSESYSFKVRSKKAGLLIESTDAPYQLIDYAYTNLAAVMALDNGFNQKSAVLNYNKKTKKILDNTLLEIISVTKLPSGAA